MPTKSGVGNSKTEALKAPANDLFVSGPSTGPKIAEDPVPMELVAAVTTGGLVTVRAGAGATFTTAATGRLTASIRSGGGPTSGRYGMAACAIAPKATTVASAFNEAIPNCTGRFIIQGGETPPNTSSENFAGT